MPSAISFCCDKSNMEKIIKNTLNLAKHSKILSEMTQNFSCEGGFQLPLTTEWCRRIASTPSSGLLQYHNARQLRFVMDNGSLTGLRLKDELPYWSHEELQELTQLLATIGVYASVNN